MHPGLEPHFFNAAELLYGTAGDDGKPAFPAHCRDTRSLRAFLFIFYCLAAHYAFPLVRVCVANTSSR